MARKRIVWKAYYGGMKPDNLYEERAEPRQGVMLQVVAATTRDWKGWGIYLSGKLVKRDETKEPMSLGDLKQLAVSSYREWVKASRAAKELGVGAFFPVC